MISFSTHVAQQQVGGLNSDCSNIPQAPSTSCPPKAPAGVGQVSQADIEGELDDGLDYFAAQGERDKERLGRNG